MFNFNRQKAADSYEQMSAEFDEIELKGVNTGFKQTRGLERLDALGTNEDRVYEEESKVVKIHKRGSWDYQESIDQATEIAEKGKWKK